MEGQHTTDLHRPSLVFVTPALVRDLNLAIALHLNDAVTTEEANVGSIASDGLVAVDGDGCGLPGHLEGLLANSFERVHARKGTREVV